MLRMSLLGPMASCWRVATTQTDNSFPTATITFSSKRPLAMSFNGRFEVSIMSAEPAIAEVATRPTDRCPDQSKSDQTNRGRCYRSRVAGNTPVRPARIPPSPRGSRSGESPSAHRRPALPSSGAPPGSKCRHRPPRSRKAHRHPCCTRRRPCRDGLADNSQRHRPAQPRTVPQRRSTRRCSTESGNKSPRKPYRPNRGRR